VEEEVKKKFSYPEYHKKWTKEHKEERRLYRQEWYQRNKPRINAHQLEYKKARYKIDPEYRERLKGYYNKWREKNMEYCREYQRKKYATDPVFREKSLARSRARYRRNK
jgi:hypothetical protein